MPAGEAIRVDSLGAEAEVVVHAVPLRSALPRERRSAGAAALELPDARLKAFARAIDQAVRARPLASIAAAIGLGLALGGVLSIRAGRVVVSVGGRYIARAVLKQLL